MEILDQLIILDTPTFVTPAFVLKPSFTVKFNFRSEMIFNVGSAIEV